MADISDFISFQPKGSNDNRPPKVNVNVILERPVRILKWVVKNSRFTDCVNGLYVEIEGEIISNGEQWRINTASGVIIDQLHNIEKAMIKQRVEDRSFTCVFKRSNKCIKMFPVEEKNNVGNSEQ